MDARIRRAKAEDVPSILAVVEAGFAEYGLLKEHCCGFDDMRRLPASYRDGAFLVAERRGRIVGCGGLMRKPDGIGEIRRMFLLPQARGKGLGRAILKKLIAAARRRRMRRLVLETSLRFQDAIALYLREGFDACVLDEDCCCSVVMFRATGI
jgi:putative acetyltransferase